LLWSHAKSDEFIRHRPCTPQREPQIGFLISQRVSLALHQDISVARDASREIDDGVKALGTLPDRAAGREVSISMHDPRRLRWRARLPGFYKSREECDPKHADNLHSVPQAVDER